MILTSHNLLWSSQSRPRHQVLNNLSSQSRPFTPTHSTTVRLASLTIPLFHYLLHNILTSHFCGGRKTSQKIRNKNINTEHLSHISTFFKKFSLFSDAGTTWLCKTKICSGSSSLLVWQVFCSSTVVVVQHWSALLVLDGSLDTLHVPWVCTSALITLLESDYE